MTSITPTPLPPRNSPSLSVLWSQCLRRGHCEHVQGRTESSKLNIKPDWQTKHHVASVVFWFNTYFCKMTAFKLQCVTQSGGQTQSRQSQTILSPKRRIKSLFHLGQQTKSLELVVWEFQWGLEVRVRFLLNYIKKVVEISYFHSFLPSFSFVLALKVLAPLMLVD